MSLVDNVSLVPVEDETKVDEKTHDIGQLRLVHDTTQASIDHGSAHGDTHLGRSWQILADPGRSRHVFC